MRTRICVPNWDPPFADEHGGHTVSTPLYWAYLAAGFAYRKATAAVAAAAVALHEEGDDYCECPACEAARPDEPEPAPEPGYETDDGRLLVNLIDGVLMVSTMGWRPAYVRISDGGGVTLSTPADDRSFAILPGNALTIKIPTK